jgi:adenylyltransferase/sulfurtransferase
MHDAQLLRYSRQILLPQIGIEGQEKLRRARVLIVGLGGLGSPVAMYLAAAGVGHLTLADGDRVDLTNLQRQIAHTTQTVGTLKAESARNTLHALNPEVEVQAIATRLGGNQLAEQVARADVVVDGSDNFETRFAVNHACVQARKPLVSGAVARLEGQVSVFDSSRPDSPCYACLYRDEGGGGDEACATFGVLAPVPGIIGSIQATEVIKLITGIGTPLIGRLLLLDAATMEWRTMRLPRDPACPVCAATETCKT